MSDKKRTDRRSFLRLTGTGMLAALAGCYGVSYSHIKRDCKPKSKNHSVFRVMSYNIANARGNNPDFWHEPSESDVYRNLEGIIQLARDEDIDVLCLNEVDFDSARTYNIDQAEYISQHLCYNHVIKDRMFSLPSVIDVGNAIISRHPSHINYHRQYGTDFIERAQHLFKSMLDFYITIGDTYVNMIFTHLDHESAQTRELEAHILLEHLKNKENPFVLLGDFNCGPGSSEFNMIRDAGLVHNPYLGLPTYRSHSPEYSIDHVLVSNPLKITNYRTKPVTFSDHRPVIADIIL